MLALFPFGFKAVEDGDGYVNIAATAAEEDVGLVMPVEVRAAGGEEVVLDGEVEHEGGGFFIVVRVPDFQTVHARLGQMVDDRGEMRRIVGLELDRVGDGGEPAGVVDALDRLARSEAFLGEEGGAGGTEVDIKGLLDAGDMIGADEGFGNVRAADDHRRARRNFLFGDLFDLLHRDVATELIEAGDDLRVALVARVEQDFGHFLETGRGGVNEMAEDVERAGGGIIRGDFDPGDEADALLLCFGGRFGEAIAGIVIREGNADEAGGFGGADEVGGGIGAVGGCRVGVEIHEEVFDF